MIALSSMTVAAVAGVASAGVAVGSAVMQHKTGEKATEAQQSANETQRKINQLKNKQAKRQFLRQFRQAKAAEMMGGVASGVGLESSRVQGGLSSLQSQATTAVNEFNRMDELGGQQTEFLNLASSRAQRANQWGMLGQFAQQFASFDFGGGKQPVQQIPLIVPPGIKR